MLEGQYCQDLFQCERELQQLALNGGYTCGEFLPDEEQRLAMLKSFKISTKREPMFDCVVDLIARACDVPIAAITIVEDHRQFFKGEVGLGVRQTRRDSSFCAHALRSPNEIFIVSDATLDPRFCKNPLVLGTPNIRFYAGAPLIINEHWALGSLCVIDKKARVLSDFQLRMLEWCSNFVMAKFEQSRREEGDTLAETEDMGARKERVKEEEREVTPGDLEALKGWMRMENAGRIDVELVHNSHSLSATAHRSCSSPSGVSVRPVAHARSASSPALVSGQPSGSLPPLPSHSVGGARSPLLTGSVLPLRPAPFLDGDPQLTCIGSLVLQAQQLTNLLAEMYVGKSCTPEVMYRIDAQLKLLSLLFHEFSAQQRVPLPERSGAPTRSSAYLAHPRSMKRDTRCCAQCNTTSTPEWRRGPLGPRTLCNACGLRFAKRQKKHQKAVQAKCSVSNLCS